MTNYENEIRAFINEELKVIRKKNIEGILPYFSKNVVQFDIVDPLQYKGAEGIRKRMEEWFASFKGDIGLEIHELRITASEEVAFSHGLKHVTANKADGDKLEMYWRETTCYRKIDGKWLITHQHSSVPFDTSNGKASLTLKP